MLLHVIITKAIIFRWNLKHFWLMIMIKKMTTHSVWTTITPWTFCRIKFVNMVGSTFFLRDTHSIFASSVLFTEADLRERRRIFSD